MFARITHSLFATSLVAALAMTAAADEKASTPPITGPFSIQMFQGGTRNVWICVNPPTAYADGTPIPDGTAVTIKVYRSSDGGKTYASPVGVVWGGTGNVGQGKAGSRQKPWIDLKLDVPVDNEPPYRVYLAATAVVSKTESAATNSNLTFSYYPAFTRYASPGDADDKKKDDDRKKDKDKDKDDDHCPSLAGQWQLAPDAGTLDVTLARGGKFYGTISVKGAAVVRLSGTVNGRDYRFHWTLSAEGQSVSGAGQMSISQPGDAIDGTLTYDGQTVPLRLGISGRTITAR